MQRPLTQLSAGLFGSVSAICAWISYLAPQRTHRERILWEFENPERIVRESPNAANTCLGLSSNPYPSNLTLTDTLHGDGGALIDGDRQADDRTTPRARHRRLLPARSAINPTR
jgi:hypothetical protein